MGSGNAVQAGLGRSDVPAKVIRCSIDNFIHRGWTRDHMGLTAVDVDILAEPDRAVPLLSKRSNERRRLIPRAAADACKPRGPTKRSRKRVPPVAGGKDAIGLWDIGEALGQALGDKPFCLMRAPLGWHVSSLPVHHPLDYLGADGAAGIGGAPGMSVGSALALRGSGRLPVAVFGDGDYLMGVVAPWTAARYRRPLLIVIANNAGYYIDEQHQVTTSMARERPTQTAPVGQRISRSRGRYPGDGQGARLRRVGPVR